MFKSCNSDRAHGSGIYARRTAPSSGDHPPFVVVGKSVLTRILRT